MFRNIVLAIVVIFSLGGCGDVDLFPDGTKPDQFTFTPQADVEKSTLVTSNTVTISGNIYPATVKVTNGEYTLDEGKTWIATPTENVRAGQKVAVRHTSSATYLTKTTTTLDISGVKSEFTSTTKAGPVIFSNYTTVFPITFDSTGKIKVESVTAAETSRNASTVSFTLTAVVTNTDSVARTVHLSVAGLDGQNRKIVPGYVAVDLSIPAGETKTDSQSLSLPISQYNQVTSWIVRSIK